MTSISHLKSSARYTANVVVVRLSGEARSAKVEVHEVRVATVILRRRPVEVRLKIITVRATTCVDSKQLLHIR